MFTEKYIVGAHYIPKPSRRRSGLMMSKVRFLVAHDTGNPGSRALDNIRYYIGTCHTVPAAQTSSAHIFVDDKQILECVPALTAPPEKAWHVLYSKPKDNELFGVNANDAAIGVEYCYGGNIDADQAYAKFIWTLAKLCYTFGLNPAKDIVGHFFLDPERKTDPVTGLARSRRTYEQMLKDVVTEYNTCTGAANTAQVLNVIQEAGSATATVKLNIRKEPRTLADIVQTVPVNSTLTFKAKTDNGQKVNNNPVWYQDANGHWFWSGGTTLISGEPAIAAHQAIPHAVAPAVFPPSENALQLAPDHKCYDFIKKHEGLRLNAYQDSAGIWTIGYGTIVYEDRQPVKKGDSIDKARADTLLQGQVDLKSAAVNAAIKGVPINQNQYNALVSFAYNVGTGALRSSSLLKLVRTNPNDPKVRNGFMMWDKAHVDGRLVELDGLKKRRTEEADLYFS